MAKTKKDTHSSARAMPGAKAPMSDLLYEAKLLVGLFPDVRDSVDKDELPVSFILKKGRDRAEAKAKKESRWTAVQRQAASDRMKKYWATKRHAKKT